MINPSRLVSSIKMDLGLIGIRMPFDNVDELIMEIVKIKTLPVFNELSPYKTFIIVDTNTLQVVDTKVESITYVLPDVFGDRQIMMINDVQPEQDQLTHRSAYQLEIFDGYGVSNLYRIEVCLEHSENLTTLPATTYTSFLKLATLDVKKYMFDNLKHYDNLSTSYGQIAMRIDDWSGAQDERQQLIEKWEQSYHLDLNQFIQV